MIDGRHCKKEDLSLLTKMTNEIKQSLSIDAIDQYIKFISRFDDEIATNIKYQIRQVNNDIDEIKKIIETNFEILKQNVIVDIYEHQ